MKDSDEDGLKYGYNSDGSGMIRFREIGATWIKVFDPDFGTNIIHQFTVGGSQNQTTSINNDWEIFPNPTNNKLIISGNTEHKSIIIINDNLGKPLISRELQSGNFLESVDLSNFESGIYFIKIVNSNRSIIKR